MSRNSRAAANAALVQQFRQHAQAAVQAAQARRAAGEEPSRLYRSSAQGRHLLLSVKVRGVWATLLHKVWCEVNSPWSDVAS